MTLLREDLLQGTTIAIGGGPQPEISAVLAGLGARVAALGDGLDEEQALASVPPDLSALVYDAGPGLAAGGPSGLQAALEGAWVAVRAVATGALIPGGRGGRIVLLAPAPGNGHYAGAARAGLENLARTLSVEWARYGITTTAIAPGASTRNDEVASLVAYLLSPAGGYFTGCRLELGAIGPHT